MLFRKKTERPSSTAVSNEFIRRFMPELPDHVVKVYLYGLMLSSDPEQPDDIAEALGADDNDIMAALSHLEALGLAEVSEGEHPIVVFRDPSEAPLASPAHGGAKYAELVSKVQNVLGTRVLSGGELSRIYDWVDLFGFEKDAAAAIVRNCLDRYGAKTSFAKMDSMATKTLAPRGAFTLAKVNEYFREAEVLSSGAASILKRWNKGRPPTMDEIALYEKWTSDWGMDAAAVDYAMTQMTAAEKPTFKYLDGIMTALRENGNVDSERIRELSRKEDELKELVRRIFEAAGLKSRPQREQKELIRSWRYEYRMGEEILLLAAGHAKDDRSPFAGLKEIVNGFHDEGISTVEAAKEFLEKNGGFAKNAKKSSRALNYMKGKTYSDEELKKLGITLGEEFYDDEDK